MAGEDLSGLSAAGGMSTYIAQKKAYEGKLAGLNAQQDTGTKSVSGSNGESTEVKSGSGNKDSEKSDIQSRIQDLDSKIASMRAQEQKKTDQNSKNQTGNAQNSNSQNGFQPNQDNNKNNGVTGSSGIVQQPGQNNASNGTGMQENRLKSSATG